MTQGAIFSTGDWFSWRKKQCALCQRHIGWWSGWCVDSTSRVICVPCWQTVLCVKCEACGGTERVTHTSGHAICLTCLFQQSEQQLARYIYEHIPPDA